MWQVVLITTIITVICLKHCKKSRPTKSSTIGYYNEPSGLKSDIIIIIVVVKLVLIKLVLIVKVLNVVPQPFEHCRKQLLAGCFGSLLYYIKEQPSVWIFWVPKTFLCVLVFIPDNASHLEFGCSRRMICITYFSQKNYDLMFPLIFLSYSYHNFYFMQIRANCFIT